MAKIEAVDSGNTQDGEIVWTITYQVGVAAPLTFNLTVVQVQTATREQELRAAVAAADAELADFLGQDATALLAAFESHQTLAADGRESLRLIAKEE